MMVCQTEEFSRINPVGPSHSPHINCVTSADEVTPNLRVERAASNGALLTACRPLTRTLGVAMAHVGVLLIALLNSVVLFFASFLAAGGDGSADGIHRVWIFGYTWIGLFTI